MAIGAPIMNIMSFPAGKKQAFEAPIQQKKKAKKERPHPPRKLVSPRIFPVSQGTDVVNSAEMFLEHNPKDNIEVLVRIRPKNNKERVKIARSVLKVLEGDTLIFDPKEDQEEFYFHGVKQKVHDCQKRPNKDMRFTFDHVFGPKRSNVEIFEETFKSVVNHIICGFSCSVFAYGATGSGKTYTMLGSHGNPGLTFLVAMELYRRISEMANEYESEVVVSYLEIYNESLRDLLRPSGILNIREDGLHGVNIPNLTTHRPKDPSEMLELLSSGNSARTQHPTDHNSESSRSHAVFQVSVAMRRRFTHSCLNYNMAKAKLVMVDLAGSERAGALGSCGEASRHREGANINKSLLALGNCINALADGKKHVPYRDSKLTRLLKDSLGGNCKTVMIANIAPTSLTYDDTYNTLKYADRAKQIRVHCQKNITTEDGHGLHHGKMVSDLQMQVKTLQALLKDMSCESCKQPMVAAPSIQREPAGNFGMGDGRKDPSTSAVAIGSPFISRTQFIADPAALENFIQLLGRKKKLDEGLTKSCVKSKEAEWKLKWKNWQIEAVTCFDKGDSGANPSDRLRSLRSQFDNLYLNHQDCKDKVEYAKRVFNFNRKEIDLVSKTFLSTLKMDEPFLTVTLSEFLYYKSLEREVGSRKSIENYYQQMCTLIFDELLRSETILASSLNYMKYLHKTFCQNHKNIPDTDDKYNEILSKLYGEQPLRPLKKEVQQKDEDEIDFPSLTSIEDLVQLIRTPVVEYEPPVTVGLAEDSQSAESGVGKIRTNNVAESSSSFEYTTSSTTKEGSDDHNWVTKSSSTSDTNQVPRKIDLMDMLINSPRLCGATTSKSSAPFSDISQTCLKKCPVEYKKELRPNSRPSPYAANKKMAMTNERGKLRKWSPIRRTIGTTGGSKITLNSDELSDSAIPLKTVPASVSISLKETPRARKERKVKPSESPGTDIVVVKAAPENYNQNKTKERPKVRLSSLKTKFTKSCNEVSGKQKQNFRTTSDGISCGFTFQRNHCCLGP